jgi:hypothetical protein
MKKSVLLAAAFIAATAASAQTGEITSNRGENWLSQDGDWGLTFDANPILNYVGNLFNSTANNNIGNGLTWPGAQTSANPLLSNNQQFAITGKKLVDANTAYRGKLRIGFGTHSEYTQTPIIPTPAPPPFPAQLVEDRERHNNFNLVLGAGLEKRVGSSRVVGVYGGEFLVGLGSSRTTYDYGNAISADNDLDMRTLEERQGNTFGLGLQGFIGIEWFFAPKMSLGGEYTWGLMLSSMGFGETTYEGWDDTIGTAGGRREWTQESTSGRFSSFGLDTGISGAAINLNFYFQ